jgi:hypothetical protein
MKLLLEKNYNGIYLGINPQNFWKIQIYDVDNAIIISYGSFCPLGRKKIVCLLIFSTLVDVKIYAIFLLILISILQLKIL